MIVSISGISTSIPSDYEEIKRRLRMLGLAPTGNPQLDKSRLQAARNKEKRRRWRRKKDSATSWRRKARSTSTSRAKQILFWSISYFFVIKSNTPLIKVKGWTGQPGIYKSIGYFSKNSLFNLEEPWKTPPEIAQAPAKITILGSGVDL